MALDSALHWKANDQNYSEGFRGPSVEQRGVASAQWRKPELLQIERPHRPITRHEHILLAVQGVRLRGIVDGTDLGMPERHRGVLVGSAVGDETARAIVREEETAGGREKARGAAS